MPRKVIAEGDFWEVTREGSEDFVTFPGSFVSYIGKQLGALDCSCVFGCATSPDAACSLSGRWHTHGGPCPEAHDVPTAEEAPQ